MSGIFGVVMPGENCAKELLYGTDYHSHLGGDFGGLAVMGHEFVRRIHRISNSSLKTEFAPDLHLLNGSVGIGVISGKDEQPLQINPVNKDIGLFTIITCGVVNNAQELASEFMASGVGFEYENEANEVNTTKLVGMLVSQADSLISGIQKMFYRINGSISLMILTVDGIIAARSLYGHSSLHLARRGKDWAIATETTAFPNLHFKHERVLKPGEIMSLSNGGPQTLSEEYHGKTQVCAFAPIYTSFPSAKCGEISAESYRMKAGAYHAQLDFDEGIQAQMVAGMADSGTAYAIGYAQGNWLAIAQKVEEIISQIQAGDCDFGKLATIIELQGKHIGYARPLIKYTPSWSARSFIPNEQNLRDLIAKMKQILIEDIWDGLESLILMEDSIVRGTQLVQYFEALRYIVVEMLGRKWPQMHIRSGSPPLCWICPYMHSTKHPRELAARRVLEKMLGHFPSDEETQTFVVPQSEKYEAMVNELRLSMGFASLRYLPQDVMVQLIGLYERDICTYCFNGVGV